MMRPEAAGKGNWRIHGVKQEDVVKAGLRLLETAVQASTAVDDLLTFPKRKNGTPVLLKEGLFKSLLTGERALKDCHKGDMSAMQGDVMQLTLRQLLKLLVENLDFVVNSLGDTHASFVQKLDTVLFEMLGKSALTAGGVTASANEARSMGLQLVMITAVADALPETGPKASQPSPWWVCWVSDRRAFFHVSNFVCCKKFPAGEGTMQIDDASKQDASHQVRMDWMMRRVEDETRLSASQVGLGAARQTAVAVAPDALRRARMKLKVLTKFGHRREGNAESA
jgi:hypothetical protein